VQSLFHRVYLPKPWYGRFEPPASRRLQRTRFLSWAVRAKTEFQDSLGVGDTLLNLASWDSVRRESKDNKTKQNPFVKLSRLIGNCTDQRNC
jgi:hypothetical protein